MATSHPMSCITKLFTGTGHLFTLYHPRGLAHTAPLTIFGYHCLANLKANIVYKVSTLLSQVNKKYPDVWCLCKCILLKKNYLRNNLIQFHVIHCTLNTATTYICCELYQFYRQVFAIKHTTTLLELHTQLAVKNKARITLASFKTGFVAGKRG